MKPEELVPLFTDKSLWKSLGGGRYHKVWVTRRPFEINGFKAFWVYKMEQEAHDISNRDRAIRKWNELNPGFPAFAVSDGWIAPYMGSHGASDEQIAEALLEIYARTRNIVFDAAGSCGNFNFVEWEGKAFCIDLDFSMRRGSIVSEEYFFNMHMEEDEEYLKGHMKEKPKTVSTVRALCDLESCFPSIYPEAYLDDAVKRAKITAKLRILLRDGVAINAPLIEALLELMTWDTEEEIPDHLLVRFLKVRRITAPAVNGQDHIIHLAATFGMVHLVRKLVEHNPMLTEISDACHQSPLLCAAAAGDNRIVSFLIARGADIYSDIRLHPAHSEYTTHQNWTALNCALEMERSDTMVLLTQAIMEEQGLTNAEKELIGPRFIEKLHVLHVAKKPLSREVTNKLLTILKFDASNDISDEQLVRCFNAHRITLMTTTPHARLMYVAAACGLLKLMERLIGHDSALVNVQDEWSQTPLMAAASEGQRAVVAFLIAQGADITKNTTYPLSHPALKEFHDANALDFAIKFGQPEIVTLLKSAGALPNRPLFKAIAEKGRPSLELLAKKIRVLYQNGANVNDNSIRKLTELMEFDIAQEIPDSLLMEFFNAGLATAAAEVGMIPIISLAANYNMPHLAKRLIEANPDFVHAKDTFNQPPLFWAAARGYAQIVDLLVSGGADIYTAAQFPETHRNSKYNHWIAISFAINNRQTTTVTRLAGVMVDKAIASRTLSTIEKEALLPEFIRKLHVLQAANVVLTADLIEELLELIKLDKENEISDSKLFEFLGKCRLPVVGGRMNAIHLAARYNMRHLVRNLITNNPHLLNITDGFNQTPLIWATAASHSEIVNFLIEQNVDLYASVRINIAESSSQAYHWIGINYAISNNNLPLISRIAQAMMDRAAASSALSIIEKSALLPKFIQKLYFLHRSNIHLTPELIEKLLSLIKLDTADEIPDNLLVKFLNSNVESAVEGQTHAIHLAAKYNMPHLVRKLVTNKAALAHIKDNIHQSPLIWAAAYGNQAIVAFLLHHNVDIFCPVQLGVTHYDRRSHNWTAINCALEFRHTAIMVLLARAIIDNALETRDLSRIAKDTLGGLLIAKMEIAHRANIPISAVLAAQLLIDSIAPVPRRGGWCTFFRGDERAAAYHSEAARVDGPIIQVTSS